MSKTSTHAGALKPGKYILVNEEPCKVISVDVSKSGKHGHAKCRVVCVGLFDGNKRSLTFPSHANVDIPIIEKNQALVTAIMGDSVMLTDNETYETFEIEMPKDEELASKIQEGANVEYWDVMGQRKIMNVKGSK
ncbi:MAG: translation initiation factor IF-5A [Candidatus Helarchaeales archaeon]